MHQKRNSTESMNYSIDFKMSTHWKYIWWWDKSRYHWFALKIRVSLPPPIKEAEEWHDLAIFQVGRNRKKKTRPCGYIIFQIPGQIEIYFRIHSDWELMTGLTNVKNQLLNILAGFFIDKNQPDKKFTNFKKIVVNCVNTEFCWALGRG